MRTSTAVSEALAIQRTISAELTKQTSMTEKLENILKGFAETTGTNSVLLYSTVDENYLELMLAYHAENYKTNLRFNEDFIGRSAGFRHSESEIGATTSSLSMPILRQNNTIGVIVLIVLS